MATKAKKAQLAPTPRIRTKTITAANLLRKIKAVVLEEPQRIDMAWWITKFKGVFNQSSYLTSCEPACGTVGCIAGWGAILLDRGGAESSASSTAVKLMTTLVGTGNYVYLELFSPSNIHGPAGTRAYARQVATLIDTYLVRYPILETRVIDVKTATVISQ